MWFMFVTRRAGPASFLLVRVMRMMEGMVMCCLRCYFSLCSFMMGSVVRAVLFVVDALFFVFVCSSVCGGGAGEGEGHG